MKRLTIFLLFFMLFILESNSTSANNFSTSDIQKLKTRIAASSHASYVLQYNNSVLGMGSVDSDLYDYKERYAYQQKLTVPTVLEKLGKVKSISTYAALKEDGSVIYWGGVKAVNLGKSDKFIQVQSTHDWVLILANDGSVYEWKAEIGKELTSKSMKKVPLKNIIQIVLRDETALALTEDGQVYTWGNVTLINSSKNGLIEGPLFGYKLERISQPQKLNTLNEKIVDIALFSGIPSVVTTTGKVITWIELEDENGKSIGYHPTYLEITDVIAVFNNSNMALKKDGTIWAWGKYLSDYSDRFLEYPPEYYPNTIEKQKKTYLASKYKDFIYLDFSTHGLGITPSGDVMVIGDNSSGQLGLGNIYNYLDFYKIQGLPKIAQISSSTNHSVALTENQDIYTWGMNSSNQTNATNAYSIIKPEKLESNLKFLKVSAGNSFTIALGTNNKLYGMGNFRNFLGEEYAYKNITPFKELPFNFKVKQLYPGHTGVTVIKENDSVSYLGGSYYDGAILSSKDRTIENIKGSEIKDVRSSDYHTAVLKKDGTVWVWENWNSGQKSIVAKKINVKDINTIIPVTGNSDTFYYAIDNKQQIWAWGDNSILLISRELPKYIEQPIKIVVGDGKKSFIDGGGYQSYFHIGVDNYLYTSFGYEKFTKAKIKAMDFNYDTAFLLTIDGEIYAQGNNHYGQLGLSTKTLYETPVKLPSIKNYYPVYLNNELNLSITPIVIDGVSYLPMRALGNALGVEILWNEKTNIASLVKGNRKLDVDIASKKVYENGKIVTNTNKPFVRNGSTYIPLRTIAENLGYKVVWKAEERAIYIE